MKITRDPIQYHHISRLYHLSMGICFTFAALAALCGVLVSWQGQGVKANPASEIIQISAQVASITPGPATGGGGSGNIPPQPLPPPTAPPPVADPHLEIFPRGNTFQGEVVIGGRKQLAYIFYTHPGFIGTTNIPRGLVFLEIKGPKNLYGSIQTDANGFWQWDVPETLGAGFYTIYGVVRDPNHPTVTAVARLDFVVVPNPELSPNQAANSPGGSGPGGGIIPGSGPSGGPAVHSLFGIFLDIVEQGLVLPGKSVTANIRLVDGRSNNPTETLVYYTVLGPDRKPVMESTDPVTFSGELSFQKLFFINVASPPGEYTLMATFTHAGKTASAVETFKVKHRAPVIPEVPPPYLYPLLVLMAVLMLIFLIVAAIAYHKVMLLSREMKQKRAEEDS